VCISTVSSLLSGIAPRSGWSWHGELSRVR
jgi:hypothetical protein